MNEILNENRKLRFDRTDCGKMLNQCRRFPNRGSDPKNHCGSEIFGSHIRVEDSGVATLQGESPMDTLKTYVYHHFTHASLSQKCTKNETRGPLYGFVSDG